MAMVAKDIKSMLTINIKSRHDSHTDQYNRIFMIKLLLISSLIMGISWYSDSINCIVPESHKVNAEFVSATCWIQGVYVYRELKSRQNEVAYFGLPKYSENDGMLPDGVMCETEKRIGGKLRINTDCIPMRKTFYLQYQWMPFFTAALALLYYIPYVLFRSANNDLIKLKNSIKEDNPDAEKIAKHYFEENGKRNMGPNLLRVLSNLFIKILYIAANAFIFYAFNYLFNGEFYYYGVQWIKWSRENNTMAYDYMGLRDFPKPGNELLPPFGYCEVYDAAKTIVESYANKHKMICEMSQNILYQYCLIVLWFAILVGIVLSVLGFLLLLLHYFCGICIRRRYQFRKKMYGISFNFRELEYIDYLMKQNIILYEEILTKIRELRK